MNGDELHALKKAHLHLVAAVQQSLPTDDQIIAGHVKDAESILSAVLRQSQPKFELTTETVVHVDWTLYRIRALVDFGDVRKGDVGGFVETENNLARDGDAWVSGDAMDAPSKKCRAAIDKANGVGQ